MSFSLCRITSSNLRFCLLSSRSHFAFVSSAFFVDFHLKKMNHRQELLITDRHLVPTRNVLLSCNYLTCYLEYHLFRERGETRREKKKKMETKNLILVPVGTKVTRWGPMWEQCYSVMSIFLRILLTISSLRINLYVVSCNG